MLPYSLRLRAGTGMAASVYVHPRCVLLKGSSCETRRCRGESLCTSN